MRKPCANTTLKSGNQYGDTAVQHENEAQYIDDSERYAYDHQGDEHGNGNPQQHQGQNGDLYHSSDGYDSGHTGQGDDGHDYYYGQGNPYGDEEDNERNMW